VVLVLVDAVEWPIQGTRIVGVPQIRSAGLKLTREAQRKTA
jgi:hypothetical protein